MICETGGQILATTEEKRIRPAADTGACAHCTGPDDLPDNVIVVPADDPRSFVGPNGKGIDHYGEANITLGQPSGNNVGMKIQVMDIVRPLHSVSAMCDKGHDMIFTNKVGIVIPAGKLDEILKTIKVVARYPREGGLYVADMMVKCPAAKIPPAASPTPFAGQVRGR